MPVLLAIALVASGAVAMLAFWAYYADPSIGQTFAWFALLGSLLLAGWSLRGGIDREVLRGLATPLALWGLGSAFVLFLGFAHGGSDAPLSMSAARFAGQLPTDNDIPRFFAEWFYFHGHNGTPPLYPGELAGQRPAAAAGRLRALAADLRLGRQRGARLPGARASSCSSSGSSASGRCCWRPVWAGRPVR